ncbi:hypothetical protein ABEF91_005005 [Exophiala dermatitidis]
MQDDPGTEDDERTIELSSIAAIYPELVVDAQDPYTATLELSVTPIKPLRIVFAPAADGAPPAPLTPPTSTEQDEDDLVDKPQLEGPTQLDTHELSHLPPVSLRITLPEGYPTTKPPVISVSVTPPWLPRSVLNKLKEDSAALWEELGKDQVVYTYIDHVQQEAENAFGLAGNPNVQLPGDLKLALLDFDLKTKREIFEKETFDCGICLEPKKGINCHRLLLCGHVFCVTCLQDFYKSCITEGDVDNVKCLLPNCGKEQAAETGPNDRPLKRRKQDRTLNPSELLQIPIEQELVQRYVRLKRKKRLEADKNTIYCPRQWCQGAARSKKHPKPENPMGDVVEESSESDEEEESHPQQPKKKKSVDPESLPMSERLAVCEDCDFAFCCVCRKGWHGELARCSPRRQQELNEEEAASLAYLQRYSTGCPTCNAPCQKTMGCNHMICFKCKTHFCYLCSSYLMPDNPYSHFNDPKGQCYMRLWVLEAGDGENIDFDRPREIEIPPDSDDDDGHLLDADLDSDDDEDHLFAQIQPVILREADDEDDDTEDEEPAPDQRRNRDGNGNRNRNMHIEIVNFAARPGDAGQNPRRIALPERPRVPVVEPAPAPHPPRQQRQGPAGRRGGGGGGGGQQGNRQRVMMNEPARAMRGGGGGGPQHQQQQQRNNNAHPQQRQVQPQPQPHAHARHPAVPDNNIARRGGRAGAAALLPQVNGNGNHIHNGRGGPPAPRGPQPRPVAAAPRQGRGNHNNRQARAQGAQPAQPAAGANQAEARRVVGLERFLQLAMADQEDEWDSDELDEDDNLDLVLIHEEMRRRQR